MIICESAPDCDEVALSGFDLCIRIAKKLVRHETVIRHARTAGFGQPPRGCLWLN